ncbi:hypothetical protein C6A37_07625, partial [Desulfobacteraceae bacterium SEEP-SAG9]
MKNILKIAVLSTALASMLIVDLPFRQLQLVPEADAILGVRRRAFRRGVIIGESAAASTSAAASQQHAAAAQQQAAAAAPPPPPPASTGKPLPIGTVVPNLPAGATATTVGDVEYYHSGGNYYRA